LFKTVERVGEAKPDHMVSISNMSKTPLRLTQKDTEGKDADSNLLPVLGRKKINKEYSKTSNKLESNWDNCSQAEIQSRYN
jgi:hypothetical protein